MRGERSLLVCYDIANENRLRKVERITEGYGYRVQKSVFFLSFFTFVEGKIDSAYHRCYQLQRRLIYDY